MGELRAARARQPCVPPSRCLRRKSSTSRISFSESSSSPERAGGSSSGRERKGPPGAGRGPGGAAGARPADRGGGVGGGPRQQRPQRDDPPHPTALGHVEERLGVGAPLLMRLRARKEEEAVPP